MERAVSFRNKKGQRLFGILHLPEITTPLSRIGVNILNPGLKNRVAPNRINVRIARMLCARGFPVLRFDPCGIGDSEGELAEGNELNMDLWGMIQRGAFVPDTLVANDFFVREARLDHLAIIGQCGGAMTAMLAAARDARVHGVILVDLPVRLLSSKLDIAELWLDTRTPDEMFREYLKKIFRARSWLNLVSMRSDFTTMKKVISRRFGARPDRDQPGGATSAGVSDRFLWPLLEACETFRARAGRCSFIFAENDLAIKEFNQDLLPVLRGEDGSLPTGAAMHVVRDANHIYTEEAWQAELLELVDRFMQQTATTLSASPG